MFVLLKADNLDDDVGKGLISKHANFLSTPLGNLMKIGFPGMLAVAFTTTALPAAADNGFSAEFLLGSADQEFTASDSIDSIKLSDNSTSYGLRGVYQFNDYFGVELAYQESGEGAAYIACLTDCCQKQ